LSTGASLGYLQDNRGASPPTIAIAIERATKKLSLFSAKKIRALITEVKEKINARNHAPAAGYHQSHSVKFFDPHYIGD
jgi:hypothetical protein